MTSNLALPLLTAGACWQGGGWNSSSASKKLYELVGVTIVSSDLSVYRGIFLYSLALFWEIEAGTVSFSNIAAEAAFALTRVYGAESLMWFQEPGSHTREPTQREDEGRSDHGEFRLPWDGKRPSLPPVLGEIWQRAKEPAQKVDLPWLLEKVPYFEDLPEKPPVRSHRPGRGNPLDNQVVAWQQTLLHIYWPRYTCLQGLWHQKCVCYMHRAGRCWQGYITSYWITGECATSLGYQVPGGVTTSSSTRMN